MTATTATLADFLLARIAEDEAAARTASPGPWRASDEERNVYECGENANAAIAVGPYGGDVGRSALHIARWDPARVLAECATKRAVMGSWSSFVTASETAADLGSKLTGAGAAAGLELAMKFLALPYADHPNYRDEWRP